MRFGWKLAKHNYPSTQGTFKTNPIISDNQTFIHQPPKSLLLFLQKLLKLGTFLVPKDPCSKVRTFPGNKNMWEPWISEIICKNKKLKKNAEFIKQSLSAPHPWHPPFIYCLLILSLFPGGPVRGVSRELADTTDKLSTLLEHVEVVGCMIPASGSGLRGGLTLLTKPTK